MTAEVTIDSIIYSADLSKPLDISLPLFASENNPLAWYIEQPKFEPVVMGNWIGSVSEGSSTNFNNLSFNPHAHGTHTECLGHITKDFYSINTTLKQFFFSAVVISITPKKINNDWVITKECLLDAITIDTVEAIIIRTLPNAPSKKHKNYCHTNPPYLDVKATEYLVSIGMQHLLIDLPSVDREEDGGKLQSHKAFWNITDVNSIGSEVRKRCTITEFVFVEDVILDGLYLLNLQIASFENDATPSKPILYQLKRK